MITLSAPFLDLFLHWSHTCTPFNFRSYLQQERWDISSMGVANEDKVKNFFENYGNLVRQRVQDCFDYPTRYGDFGDSIKSTKGTFITPLDLLLNLRFKQKTLQLCRFMKPFWSTGASNSCRWKCDRQIGALCWKI